MNDQENLASGPFKECVILKARARVRYWIYLNVWCRFLYRPVSRIMHRFHLHYAPPSELISQRGRRDHWCQWCGLRGHTIVYSELPPPPQDERQA